MSDAYTANVRGLDELVRALKQKPPTARVGVLAGRTGRNQSQQKKQGSAPTNAEIGAVHEFGSPAKNIPSRSFLRIPISEHLEAYMKKAGAFDKDALNQVMKEGTLLPYMEKIAVLAEAIVSDAFDSGGFGKWPKWRDSNYTNNAGQLLVDTQQLRNSITSEVKG